MLKQLESAGLSQRDNEFILAIALFENNGGTYERAIELLNAAYRTDGEAGHEVPKGRGSDADPSNPIRSAGHSRYAKKASGPVPASSDLIPGKGQAVVRTHLRKKPGHARRGAAAIASVQETVSRSLFDTIKLPDGRRLREIRWSEVPDLARRYTYLARVMTLCHRTGTPIDPNMTLDQLVKEDELKEIVDATERLNYVGI